MDSLHALIVDDDASIRDLLCQFLEKNNFTVDQAGNTQEADAAFNKQPPDVLLLDLMMPGEDGISFCRRKREDFNGPIIMLTAVDEEVEQVVAHEVGADDFLTKPYNMRILLAKIKSALRRYRLEDGLKHPVKTEKVATALTYEFATWHLSTANHQFTHTQTNKNVKLSSAEYDLLVTFLEHPLRILTRDQLIQYTQGNATEIFDRSVDVLISRLRHKVEDNPKQPKLITTMRSEGYLFDCSVKKLQLPITA